MSRPQIVVNRNFEVAAAQETQACNVSISFQQAFVYPKEGAPFLFCHLMPGFVSKTGIAILHTAFGRVLRRPLETVARWFGISAVLRAPAR